MLKSHFVNFVLQHRPIHPMKTQLDFLGCVNLVSDLLRLVMALAEVLLYLVDPSIEKSRYRKLVVFCTLIRLCARNYF